MERALGRSGCMVLAGDDTTGSRKSMGARCQRSRDAFGNGHWHEMAGC